MAKPGDPFFRVTAVHLDGSYRCTQISGSYAEGIAEKVFNELLNDVTVAFCCWVQIGDVDFVKSAHMKAYSPSTGEWDTDT